MVAATASGGRGRPRTAGRLRSGAQRRAIRRSAASRSISAATTPTSPYGRLATSVPSGPMIPVIEPCVGPALLAAAT